MKNIHIMTYTLLLCTLFLTASQEQPTTVYCHGLGGSEYEFHGLLEHNIIHKPTQAIAFKKENDAGLGHGIDIDRLKSKLNPKKRFGCVGTSRGGTVIINLIAQENPENIDFLIIDATPADMLNIVDEIQYKAGIFVLWTRAQKEWATRLLFPNYPVNSIPPAQAIANIKNKELPVFIVHSENDPIVNIRSAWQNYKAFKQAKFPHVYLCELQEGGHMGNPSGPDSYLYKQAINSFYKKHGFKFHEELAILTEEELALLQPTEQEIDQKLAKNLQDLRKQLMSNIKMCAQCALLATTIILHNKLS